MDRKEEGIPLAMVEERAMDRSIDEGGASLPPRFLKRLADLVPPFARQSPWILALSGGPDSVALCHLLARAKWELEGVLPERLVCVHVHHGLRGAEADQDLAFSEALAGELGFEFRSRRLEPSSASGSVEDWARSARYAALEEVAVEIGACAVFTGHQKSDQAETVLARLIRDSGIQGLSGIRPVRRLREGSKILLIRPLLSFTREEILDYLESEGRSFMEDRTNLDLAFDRNRIRHKVLPALVKASSDSLDALCQIAEESRRLDRMLDYTASVILSRPRASMEPLFAPFLDPECRELVLDRALLKPLHSLLLYPVLKKGIARVGGLPDPSLSKKAYQAAAAALKSDVHKNVIHLSDDVEIGIEGECVWLRKGGRSGTVIEPILLSIPGSMELPDGSVIRAKILDDRLEAEIVRSDSDLLREVVDADNVGSLLKARPRRPGDRFHPLGAAGKKKLKSFLIDRKVPERHRDGLALVCRGDEIVWVAGVRIGHPFRVLPSTKRYLILEASPPTRPADA